MFICCLHTVAQDSEYVYKDSTILSADSIVTKKLAIDTKKNNSANDNELFDTTLQNKQFAIFKDSAEGLKKEEALKYAKNLDSILIALQKQQKALQRSEKPSLSWLERFFFSFETKIFFYIFSCIFIGFIVYKLFIAEGIFQWQTTANKVTVLPDEEILQFALINYDKLLSLATENKNYSLAIRYHYLQTLQKLAAKNVIQFTPDKTNYEYLREMFDKPYKNEFASLTLQYEYVWYGKFDTSEAMFVTIQKKFKQFNNKL